MNNNGQWVPTHVQEKQPRIQVLAHKTHNPEKIIDHISFDRDPKKGLHFFIINKVILLQTAMGAIPNITESNINNY